MDDVKIPWADRSKPKYQPPPPVKRRAAEYVLPDSVVHRALFTQALERGVMTTTADGIKGRYADSAVSGQVSIMPRDTREARDGKPIIFVDAKAGEDTLVIVGGRSEHWQDLKDRADEARHYGWTKTQRRSERPDIQRIWSDHIEDQWNKEHGRYVYGNETKGKI